MPVEAIRALLRGRVRFRAAGGFADLFLEACAAQGASLREIKQSDGGLCAWADEADYPKVLIAAKQSGMSAEVIRRTGLPQLLRRYRARVGIPVGLLLGALLLAALAGRIWEVTVTGNETVGSEEILDILTELGVAPGAAIRKLDMRAAAKQAGERLPKLSWIAVNLNGCKVSVEVREVIETPSLTDERDYCNLVAARDGVIVRADVLEGAGQPLIGSAVVHGDLLVSGVIEMKNGFQRFVNAKAQILAQTRTELSIQREAAFSAECVVKRREVRRLRFFGVSIPLGVCMKEAQMETTEYHLRSRTTDYPIGMLLDRCAVYETRELTLSEEDAALLCFADFCALAFERYREAELLHREISVSVKSGVAQVAARCECIEDICERQPFAVDDSR